MIPIRSSQSPLLRALFLAACLAWPGAGRAGEEAKATDIHQAKGGPWGVIEYSYLYLEATDELIANIPMPTATPRWVFAGATESVARALFQKAALPPAMVARLLDKKRMVQQPGSLTVFPTLEDLEAMTPAMRVALHEHLEMSPGNEFYKDPVIFVGGIEPWLRDARIRDDIKAKIRKMAYPRGKTLIFSDVQALLAHAQSESEARRLLKLCTRVRTILAQVKVTPQTDFNELYEYWSDRRRARDIRPFLESIAERPADASLDLIHLLPRAARRFLYSYPTLDLAARGRLPDCHWTSLNFFSLAPQDYYLDTRLAASAVLAKYSPSNAPYIFGDLLFFTTSAGDAIHSCVYLADDIVYTKNGENLLSPWVLMHLEDLNNLYSHKPGITVSGYRRKPAEN